MKEKSLRLIAWAYLAALVLWFCFGCIRIIKTAWYDGQGLHQQETLSWEQLEPVGMIQLESQQEGFWYVSTDSDPQFLYKEPVYLNRVRLYALHTAPSLSVVAYWKTPGQQDFSSKQSVYARQIEPGVYEFDLGGRLVQELRIDPDSKGGIITHFEGIELNPSQGWYMAFCPSATQMLLLVLLPLLGAAVVAQCLNFSCKSTG
ncbi:MAG: hypothetical protein H9882_05495 [Candidatus Fournierella pullistercoris]|uniref:Uncharacterized protein n=1 Tax=Candidatus Allofournierella pullistercoris TaxID=2838597 RepID=A0A948T3B9_9FIRM|nr:hypothetical protein [Candidatus Fournierella pullistercoris]